jgi:hypothetical protein
LLSSTELKFFQKHGLFDLGYSLSSYFDPQLTMIWGFLARQQINTIYPMSVHRIQAVERYVAVVAHIRLTDPAFLRLLPRVLGHTCKPKGKLIFMAGNPWEKSLVSLSSYLR